jgi:hypothetical protein
MRGNTESIAGEFTAFSRNLESEPANDDRGRVSVFVPPGPEDGSWQLPDVWKLPMIR